MQCKRCIEEMDRGETGLCLSSVCRRHSSSTELVSSYCHAFLLLLVPVIGDGWNFVIIACWCGAKCMYFPDFRKQFSYTLNQHRRWKNVQLDEIGSVFTMLCVIFYSKVLEIVQSRCVATKASAVAEKPRDAVYKAEPVVKVRGQGAQPPAPIWAPPRNNMSPLIKSIKCYFIPKLEFGMYPQSTPTEWTHARTLRPWQSVRLDLWRLVLRGL